MKDKEPEIKFEKALAELRGIVDKLEAGDLELDESLKLFERGVRLIGSCSKRLEDAQRRVEVATQTKDGKRVLREFPEGEGVTADGDELDETTEEEEKG
jgi:exodeoxyribonuclease VII small subunit